MKRLKVTVGDIALVPTGDGRAIPAKVIYASSYFKDVILLALYRSVATEGEPIPTLESPALLIYTSQAPISKGRWPKAGYAQVNDQERHLAKRIVAGDVWLADECLGPASVEDHRTLPKMVVAGAGLVEERAASLAAGLPGQ
jgi:hypothetical protein